MTERTAAERLLAFNSYSYGGRNDWKIVFQIRCAHAGRIEFSAHKTLSSYSHLVATRIGMGGWLPRYRLHCRHNSVQWRKWKAGFSGWVENTALAGR
jgi:hypothetical protein